MFGTLRVDRARLSPALRTSYRAHFCGACHALRAAGGRGASLTTNYDQTVLALVLGALHEGGRSEQRPCTAFPWRTVAVEPMAPRAAALLAAANLGAVEAKLRDDLDDEGWWRRGVRRSALALLRQPLGSARGLLAHADLAEVGELLAALPARQRAVERARGASLRQLSAPSAALGAAVFGAAAQVSGRPRLAPALRRFGAALAGFVYALDAVEDRAQDRRRGRFNALDASGAGLDAVARRLAVEVDACEAALAVLPQGDQRQLLAALLGSMRTRAERSVAREVRRAAPEDLALRGLRPAEAGECDVCCAAEGCSGCGECSACGGATEVSCCCADFWCCGRGGRRSRRREK